jgi:hypothetical protein
MIGIGLLALTLAGCMTEQDEWLQGKWAQGDVHYFAEWNFNSGTYNYSYDYTASSTSNRYEQGRYAVKEATEDYLVLELFNRLGSDPSLLEENERIKITINLEEDSIRFRGQTYYRVWDSSLQAIQTSQAP